jgi:hypothetical protein
MSTTVSKTETSGGGRVRIKLGWTSGSQPAGLYLALALWALALAAATLLKQHTLLASVSVFVSGALLVAFCGRGYVEISNATISVAPHGALGPNQTWALRGLSAVEVRGEGTLVFLAKDGTEQSFGPWKSYWASSSGMRVRSDCVAETVRARLTDAVLRNDHRSVLDDLN